MSLAPRRIRGVFGICLHRVLVEMRVPRAMRWLNFSWCGVIAYSTLSTKQHVVVDVIGGVLLGWIGGKIGATKTREKRTRVSRARESVLLSE